MDNEANEPTAPGSIVRDADGLVWERDGDGSHNWHSPETDMWADWCDLVQPVVVP